ncbi:MAG TPA: DUF5082 family protein [Pseudogracilibacillus sp.]|nr:DUF5082 family protein [Pseudogracilibacillus sp.]
MRDLASINTYLRETDSRIASAQMQMYDREEELRRLEEALSDLESNKSDFINKKVICLDPKFTSKTLHGSNADNLDDIREGQVQKSFLAIPEDQISNAIEIISDKITEVKERITDLENTISDLESRRQDLLQERARVESEK